MPPDEIFRRVLAVGFVLLVPIGVFFRMRARAGGEKLDRRQEGIFILLTLRPIGIACMLGLIAYLIEPQWMAWSAVPLPVRLRWLGVGIGVVAGGLLIWTFSNLGKNLTDTVVTRKQHTLVQSGPYRWVRHPFYVSVALALLANALATANWFIFVTGALLMLLLVMRTRREEERLLARFGQSYEDYMQRTGRFWPRLGR